MVVKCLVMSERPDEYTGKRGLVKQQMLLLMDQTDGGERCSNPFEYALSEEEKVQYVGKLADKIITLAMYDLTPFGGRIRVRKGKIVAVLTK